MYWIVSVAAFMARSTAQNLMHICGNQYHSWKFNMGQVNCHMTLFPFFPTCILRLLSLNFIHAFQIIVHHDERINLIHAFNIIVHHDERINFIHAFNIIVHHDERISADVSSWDLFKLLNVSFIFSFGLPHLHQLSRSIVLYHPDNRI